MARDYANIFTAIWREPDWKALPSRAQRTYFMLVTQPDISAAGTLDLTAKRWAKLAADTTVVTIRADLEVLAAARFVFVDEDTEELLVRTFVKHDKGYGNSKRRGAIVDAAKGLESPQLRQILWVEFEKLSIAHVLPSTYITAGNRASDALFEIDDVNPDRASAKERVVVTEVSKVPQPSNRKPTNASRSAAQAPAHDEHDAGETTTAQTLVGEWLERCAKRPPGQVIGIVSKQIKEMLAEGIDPDDIRRGIATWMLKPLHPSTLASVVNEVMNVAPGSLARASPGARPTGTDATVNGWLNLRTNTTPERQAIGS
jgi:hypothetical protein